MLSSPRVGVHLSLGKNPRLSVREARQHGARCIQIFCSSPGAWKPPLLPEEKLRAFRQARHEQDVEPLFIHAIYLINLASADPALVRRSVASLVAALEAGAAMGAAGVVTHLGSHGGRGYDAVAVQIAECILEVVECAPAGVALLLENSAGAGGILGATFVELTDIIVRARRHPRLRVALDTAHLCAAGWDFQRDGVAEELVATLQDTIGLDRLMLVHANDSRVPCGSRRDRHANVGDGYVGDDGFRRLLSRPELTAVPWILETPDLDTALEPGRRFGSLGHLLQLAAAEPQPAGG